MTSLKDILNRVRYSIYRRSIQHLPYREQLKVARETYDIVDEAYKGKVGDNIGVCTVDFQCPYEGHVAYHCNRALGARKNDASDILTDYVIEKTGDNDWRLTVVVATCESDSHVAADAVAMSSVLRIPTVLGDFNRSCKVATKASLGVGLTEISFC